MNFLKSKFALILTGLFLLFTIIVWYYPYFICLGNICLDNFLLFIYFIPWVYDITSIRNTNVAIFISIIISAIIVYCAGVVISLLYRKVFKR